MGFHANSNGAAPHSPGEATRMPCHAWVKLRPRSCRMSRRRHPTTPTMAEGAVLFRPTRCKTRSCPYPNLIRASSLPQSARSLRGFVPASRSLRLALSSRASGCSFNSSPRKRMLPHRPRTHPCRPHWALPLSLRGRSPSSLPRFNIDALLPHCLKLICRLPTPQALRFSCHFWLLRSVWFSPLISSSRKREAV